MGNLAVCGVLCKVFQHRFAVQTLILHGLHPLTNVLYYLTCYYSRVNHSNRFGKKNLSLSIYINTIEWFRLSSVLQFK
jgi:hypothetical protein